MSWLSIVVTQRKKSRKSSCSWQMPCTYDTLEKLPPPLIQSLKLLTPSLHPLPHVYDIRTCFRAPVWMTPLVDTHYVGSLILSFSRLWPYPANKKLVSLWNFTQRLPIIIQRNMFFFFFGCSLRVSSNYWKYHNHKQFGQILYKF